MSETNVLTGKVRFSYAKVFEPVAMNEGDKLKYSVAILIPKDDTPTVERIKAGIEAAKQEGKSQWGNKIPASIKVPLRDGDDEKPDDENYENMYFINCNSDTKPGIVDKKRKTIMSDEAYLDAINRKTPQEIKKVDEDRSEEKFYSGCWGRVTINFYPYSKNSKGVACGLNNIQKWEDGESLGSARTSAFDDFADEPDGMLE